MSQVAEEPLDLARSALVLMDFQNDVVDPQGAIGRLGGAALVAGVGGTLDAAEALLDGFRAAGKPVVHVAVAFRPGYPDADPAVPLSRLCIELGCLMEGTWGPRSRPRCCRARASRSWSSAA